MTQLADRPNKVAQDDDARLGTLMKEWRAIEPSPDFDRGVWDRIRSEAVTRPARPTVIDFLRWVLAQPAWAAAAAAVIGLGLGLGAALVTPPSTSASTQTERLLQRDTLAGSYLAMTTGALR